MTGPWRRVLETAYTHRRSRALMRRRASSTSSPRKTARSSNISTSRATATPVSRGKSPAVKAGGTSISPKTTKASLAAIPTQRRRHKRPSTPSTASASPGSRRTSWLPVTLTSPTSITRVIPSTGRCGPRMARPSTIRLPSPTGSMPESAIRPSSTSTAARMLRRWCAGSGAGEPTNC